MRQAQGLIYLGTLCLLVACARRKPAMIKMNGIDIAVLDMDDAWNNYTDAMHRSHDAKCASMRERYKSVAIASLDTYFRWVDRLAMRRPVTIQRRK
jgi:hypothetical protein